MLIYTVLYVYCISVGINKKGEKYIQQHCFNLKKNTISLTKKIGEKFYFFLFFFLRSLIMK